MQDEEWGPWIEHDGKGCPCVGLYIQLELDRDAVVCPDHKTQISARLFEGKVTPAEAHFAEWDWSWGPRVIRYRIRKPRALLDLIERARELDDAPEGPRVTRKVPA